MAECNLDHSLEDVKNKFNNQQEFLPDYLVKEWHQFLKKSLTQPTLNEAFHLLKKYDLITKKEQEIRDKQMIELFSKHNM
ncbi:group-specific protein [Salipaludibacillus keqinensis]|uniref:Group-specific protein n=1 Tax=Salipaludibacillus keqinensis TaxID=2045207 RepID=A0A323TMC2_9BACI|nr:group-specific protein [Salipaludibacillus keqinensis]PYZ95196.1 group-specific protein [Salipaludibacillus keqinensis]